MKIEKPGFYRTRDGRKVEIAAINPNAAEYSRCIGWTNGMIFACSTEGALLPYKEHCADLVSEWTDPAPWDWSTTPPWVNWIAMDENAVWHMYDAKPKEFVNAWGIRGASCHRIPQTHQPKWSGDWRKSLTMRPGHKEAK